MRPRALEGGVPAAVAAVGAAVAAAAAAAAGGAKLAACRLAGSTTKLYDSLCSSDAKPRAQPSECERIVDADEVRQCISPLGGWL
jgi:hypothetical protein